MKYGIISYPDSYDCTVSWFDSIHTALEFRNQFDNLEEHVFVYRPDTEYEKVQNANNFNIEFSDLVGEHELSGVEEGIINISKKLHLQSKMESNCLYFVLDGITYCVAEDPEDGYRSSMAGIAVVDYEIKNTFSTQKVFVMKSWDKDTLLFVDMRTGLPVLEIGTDNNEDYYPCFVASFMPQNMAINKDNE